MTESTSSGTSASPPAALADTDAVRERHIHEVVDRLAIRFSGQGLSRAEPESRTRDAYRAFTTSRISDFLAILVERQVRRSLENRTHPRSDLSSNLT